MKHVGVVVDDSYWEAVEEMKPSSAKWEHYLFGGEPMLSLLRKKGMIIENDTNTR